MEPPLVAVYMKRSLSHLILTPHFHMCDSSYMEHLHSRDTHR